MSEEGSFNLRGVIEASISELQNNTRVYDYLLELSEDELTQSLSDRRISEISGELVKRLFEGKQVED